MRFARWTFWAAGGYGLIVLTPQLFLEERLGREYPPAVTHPEFFYGFTGLALAWQVLFLVLGTDPVRFRPIMLPAILEKASFAVPTVVLFVNDRVNAVTMTFAAVDAVWGLLFALAWIATARNDHPELP